MIVQKKIRILLLVSIYWMLCSNYVHAQQIIYSPTSKINITTDDFAVLGSIENTIAAYKLHNKQHEILFYNSSMQLQQNVVLETIPESAEQISCFISNNTILVYYQLLKAKVIQLYGCAITTQGVGKEVLIDSFSLPKARTTAWYTLKQSTNKKHILACCGNNTDNNLDIRTIVVNDALEVENKCYQTFLKTSDVVYNSAITNDGTCYILTTDSKYNKITHDDVSILCKKLQDTEYGANAVTFNNYAISKVYVYTDDAKDALGICAFYRDSKYSIPRGLAVVLYSQQTKGIVQQYYTPLSLQGTKSRFDLRDLEIRSLHTKKDGSMEIVTEKTYQNTINTTRTGMVATNIMMTSMEPAKVINEYHNNEIAIFNLKKDGSIFWTQTILKQQQSIDDDGIFSSFGELSHTLGNAYLFNDDVQHASRLMVSFINNSGTILLKEIQQPLTEKNIMFLPRSAKQISSTEIAFPCLSNGNLSFAKINFK